MKIRFDPHPARQALAQLPELAAQESLTPPDLARIYVPKQHAKAVHLDASVVVGMRGAGKSWWTAVLSTDTHREFVSQLIPGSSLARVTAKVGFGLDETEVEFPRAETLGDLTAQGFNPADIWHTVVLRHALRTLKRPVPFPERAWKKAVQWTINNREKANDLITQCDEQLNAEDRILLVLFDAFDRLSTDWGKVRHLTSGALMLGLRLRSRKAIRAKFFIRPDLEEDDEVWQFPDSSKLRHAKVDLAWSSADLYGLIFMHLGNDPSFGPRFRGATSRSSGGDWTERDGIQVPGARLANDEVQRPIIEALADSTMGGDRKRGYTFTWVPLHLADAKGRISPRSYLLAFKMAAEHTAEHRPDHVLALFYQSIQQGVVRASAVRVNEICEDYPWVKPLLEAARGCVVPITADEISRRWSPECLRKMDEAVGAKLPPLRFTNDPFRKGSTEALIDDLVDLAVLYRAQVGRLNMPDIFRVGFGIRRKGGVKPPR